MILVDTGAWLALAAQALSMRLFKGTDLQPLRPNGFRPGTFTSTLN